MTGNGNRRFRQVVFEAYLTHGQTGKDWRGYCQTDRQTGERQYLGSLSPGTRPEAN